MARYWVGDSGSWDDTAHWASSSGGTGGASVPTSSDNTFFDANSFSLSSQTVTIPASVSNACHDVDFTGVLHAPTLSFPSIVGTSNLDVYGSLTLALSLTVSTGGTSNSFSFVSSSAGKTINTFGLSIPVDFVLRNFGGADYTLQNDLVFTSNSSLVVRGSQTLNTNGKTVTINGATLQLTQSGVLNLGASTINLNATGTDDVIFEYDSGTLDTGTSSLVFNNAGTGNWQLQDNVGGNTYNNVIISGQGFFSEVDFTITTLILNPGANVQVGNGNTLTVSTFTANGTTGAHIIFTSDIPGTQFTISASTVSVSYVDVTDSVAAGSTPFVDTNGVDNGNNINWTFPTATTTTNATFLLEMI